MNIKEAEVVTGVSKRNIRYYEQAGLIKPSRNTENDYREYSQADVDTLKLIRALRMIDMPLEQIKQILQNQTTLHDAAATHKQMLLAQKKRIELAISFCDAVGNASSPEDVVQVLQKMDEPQNKKELYKKWYDDHKSDLEWILMRLGIGLIPTAMCFFQAEAHQFFLLFVFKPHSPVMYLLAYTIVLIIWACIGYGVTKKGKKSLSFALCHLLPILISAAIVCGPEEYLKAPMGLAVLHALHLTYPISLGDYFQGITLGHSFILYLLSLFSAFALGMLLRMRKERKLKIP